MLLRMISQSARFAYGSGLLFVAGVWVVARGREWTDDETQFIQTMDLGGPKSPTLPREGSRGSSPKTSTETQIAPYRFPSQWKNLSQGSELAS